MSWKTHIATVRNKPSRINGILHRLTYYFSQNILITLYKSLFTHHINYESLLWGQAGENLDKIQKKTIRTITYNNYTAHTEPLLKELNLLNVKVMFDLKVLKFLFKLYHNELPPYFNSYRVHLEKNIIPYTLHPHALPVPAVAHVYAKSSLVYKLVVMKNRIAISDKLILRRIDDQSFPLIGFNQLVINEILSNYT